MATIELGELATDSPESTWTEIRAPRPSSRPLRVAVLLVVLLGTLAGGAPAARPLPESGVPARLGATVFAIAGRLIVADPVNIGEEGQWLTAYRLPGGERLWQRPMPLRGNAGPWAVVGSTLLISAEWGAVIPPETVALDLATGAEKWRRIAWLDGATESGEALLWTSRHGDWAQGEERPGTLRKVSVETGSERWALPLPAGALRAYQRADGWQWSDMAARLLVVALPSGEFQVRELDTGQVTGSVHPPAPRSGRWYADVTDDLLLLNSRDDAALVYGLADLTPRWTLNRRTRVGEYGPLPCGALLCVYGYRGGVRALDPATGEVRWSDERWGSLRPVQGRLVADEARGSSSRARPLIALDPATGTVLSRLGVWEVVGPAPGGGLLATRPGPEGLTWVAHLDVARGTSRLLGRISDIAGDCHASAAARALFCRRISGSIGIWRLPDPPR